ncbi:MAG: ParB/RepB/Spo0J family partition protein [Chloroflexi bacterium]|nr:ParB/RepB/Spo0J family partition protein [Chloroflexota bacterium]
MVTHRGGLGRGLSALIPGGNAGPHEVELNQISPNPRQPRQRIDPTGLASLAESIREHGLLQPLVVTEAAAQAGQYVLIAGERRWQAAQMAGLTRVPVLVKEATPEQMLALALVENIQRADLNPLEEAAAFKQLIEEFGLTQEEVARRIGRSRVAVTNSLRLLQLPEPAKVALAEGQISEGHARALLGTESAAVLSACLRRVVDDGLSVRETEELVRRARRTEESAAEREAIATAPDTQAIEAALQEVLGTRVNLYRSSRGGRLVIHFYTEEQLQGLYDLLMSAGRQ